MEIVVATIAVLIAAGCFLATVNSDLREQRVATRADHEENSGNIKYIIFVNYRSFCGTKSKILPGG